MPLDPPAGERDDLGAHVRSELLPLGQTVMLRGGPDNLDKLRRHAARTHRAFVFDGRPVYGVSVFGALDEIGPASIDGLLSGRLATYRWVHRPTAGELTDAGFALLATFARPTTRSFSPTSATTPSSGWSPASDRRSRTRIIERAGTGR